MDLITPAVGLGLTVLGAMGIRDPENWGKRYQRLIDRMPNYYREASAWDGSERELSIRLSVMWIAVGSVFLIGWLVILAW